MKKAPVFHTIIASGFGTGYSPFAPGTVGALLAAAIWVAFSFVLPAQSLLILTGILIVVFGVLGIYSTDKVIPFWGKDPSRVVVDEMVGVWIPMLAADIDKVYTVVAAFVLFRLFDIFKPLGVRKMEALKGGIGVMMDDVLAGIYSLIILLLMRWLIG